MTNEPEVWTLDGLTTGKYVITTSHGTRHFVDLDACTVVRYGADGREWGERVLFGDMTVAGGSRPKAVVWEETVTPDGSPFQFTSIRNATVGESMKLDNSDEWRVTSPIVSIEKLEG